MKTVRLGIIGTGTIGTIYGRICTQMNGVNLTAIHDLDKEKVEALAREWGARAYSGGSYTALLRENPEIDGVLICTPQDHHMKPALATIEAGKHFQIEKPLSSNLEDAQNIVSAAVKMNLITMVNYSLRFDPRYVAMKKVIDEGAIGDIRYIYAQRNPPFAGLGGRVRAGIEELPFWTGIHDIDMMRWITGSEVTSIYATCTSTGYEKMGLIGAILTNLEFQNGVIATLENAWREITPDSNLLLSTASFRVHGTRGSVEIRSDEQGVKIIEQGLTRTPDTVNMPEIWGQIVGTYRNQTEYFVRCLQEHKHTDVPLTEGLKGVMAAEGILISLQEDRKVKLAEEYPDYYVKLIK